MALTNPAPNSPLSTWRDGAVKQAILAFVAEATTPGSEGYIPPQHRIATFDNDGTLWCEQPLVQGMFVLSLVEAKVSDQPELAHRPAIAALRAMDLAYFARPEAMAELIRVVAEVSAHRSQADFDQQARTFLATATHPTYGVSYTELAYQPQLDLLAYLRASGFQTWICSGGGADFMRLISASMYGIAPHQVIGSTLSKDYRQVGGEPVLWRLPAIDLINDKAAKPVGIDRAIGQPPVFACGNVRSGGDIAMLTYSQSSPYPSFQLLIDHDDGDREFAYAEPDQASLTAAHQSGWHVASIKYDWKRVFAWQ